MGISPCQAPGSMLTLRETVFCKTSNRNWSCSKDAVSAGWEGSARNPCCLLLGSKYCSNIRVSCCKLDAVRVSVLLPSSTKSPGGRERKLLVHLTYFQLTEKSFYLTSSRQAFPSPFKSVVLLFLQHLFVPTQKISVPLSIKFLPLQLFPPQRKSFIFRGLLALLKTNFKLISLFCFDYEPAPVLHLLGLHLHSVSPIIQLCTRCQSI